MADNGGPTQTHALLALSPAIDAGDPAILPSPGEFDQRGFVRVVDGDGDLAAIFDMGAYEFGASDPSPVVIDVVRNGGGQNFDELVTLEFMFTEDVEASLDKFDLVLVNNSTQVPVDLTPIAEPTWDAATNTATWTFTGAAIDRGFLRATLSAAGITDRAGNPLDGDGDGTDGDDFVTTEVAGNPLLVTIPGDLDLDGAVTINILQPFPLPARPGDALLLLPNIGITSGALWSDGDFDGDGAVTINIPQPFPNPALPGDARILLANIGMSVAVPAPDSALTFAVSDASSAALITTVEEVSGPLRAARVYAPLRAAMVVKETTLLGKPAVAHRGFRVRKASAREVDTAIIDLADERVDRHEHDHLVISGDAKTLDPAWDEGLLAVVKRPV